MDFNHYFHNEELIYTAGSSLTLSQSFAVYSFLKLSLKSPIEIDIFLYNNNPCSYGVYSRHYLRKIDTYERFPMIDTTKELEIKKVMLI